MCSPCGPMVCYKYEDCGPPLQCLPRSAFKRNGLQDCQYFQQGSIRYLCRAGPCCRQPCPPRCPPCVRRAPPGKTYKGKSSGGGHRAEEGGAQKKSEKENQLKRIKSRELRGGIMYYSCHCIKRNGLQHDCRRTGCGGEPACLTLPDPVCAPSQLARARGLADPGPLAAHMYGNGSHSGGGHSGHHHQSGAGKKFIVCELKGVAPDVSASSHQSGKCCKCSPASYRASHGASHGTSHSSPYGASYCASQCLKQNTNVGHYSGGAACYSNPPPQVMTQPTRSHGSSKCCPCGPCASATAGPSHAKTMLVLDEKMTANILRQFEQKDLATKQSVYGGGGGRGHTTAAPKKEPCTRPGCVHWQPPPPCVWDLPCKADCFETPAGIQPGRNPLVSGHGHGHGQDHGHGHGHGQDHSHGYGQGHGHGHGPGHHNQPYGPSQPYQQMKLLTPECCTGCCVPSDGGAHVSGGPADGMPVMVMKLC